MNLDPHERIREEHDAAMRDYLARGGPIERLPIGQCNWDALTNKQKINPILRPEDRAVKASAVKALPVPRAKAPRPERPKPQPQSKKVRFCPPGGQKARILELLAEGPVSAKFVAGALGIRRNAAVVQLSALRDRGMVVSTGPRQAMKWGLP